MQTIIITGASQGLGLALFSKLYPQYNIATISRSQKAEENDTCINYQGDIIHPLERNMFFDLVMTKFGCIDVLINNAGLVNLKPFLNYEENDYDNIFAINVKAAYLLSQLCIKQMLSQPNGGHIINIGSTRAITGAPDKSLYSMSKFALRSMTQCINSEFNDRNIYSTIICPGKFDDTILYETINTIEFLINNNIKLIPEIIIGGKL